MEMSAHKCETKFHSVSDMNCKQWGETLNMKEQVNLNPTSRSLMLSRVTRQFNGATIPHFFIPMTQLKQFVQKLLSLIQLMLAFEMK